MAIDRVAVDTIIRNLELKPHPEGGWYRQTYISGRQIPETLNCYGRGARPYATSIYFLLTSDSFSAFHRIQSDEIWYHHSGAPVKIEIIDLVGRLESVTIGSAELGWEPQACVSAGCWFASHLPEGEWALTGCAVAPGFDFRDFELADRDMLTEQFPQYREVIRKLTRK